MLLYRHCPGDALIPRRQIIARSRRQLEWHRCGEAVQLIHGSALETDGVDVTSRRYWDSSWTTQNGTRQASNVWGMMGIRLMASLQALSCNNSDKFEWTSWFKIHWLIVYLNADGPNPTLLKSLNIIPKIKHLNVACTCTLWNQKRRQSSLLLCILHKIIECFLIYCSLMNLFLLYMILLLFAVN